MTRGTSTFFLNPGFIQTCLLQPQLTQACSLQNLLCLVRLVCIQHDTLHQGFLPVWNRQALIGLPGNIVSGRKSQRQRVLVFIDRKSKNRQRLSLFFCEEVPVIVMKPLTLYIAVGEQGSVTANIITDSRDLIREGAVIDVVIEMDHTVSLSGLCEKLLDPAVRKAPVILCVGYVVQDGKVVGEISPRIAVKRVVSNHSPHSGGIRGFHRFYIPLRVIFLYTAVHSSRNKLNVSVNQLSQQNRCDEDTAPKQTEQTAAFFRFLAGRAECPPSSFFHRPQTHDHKDSQYSQK